MKHLTEEQKEEIDYIYAEILEIMEESNVEFSIALESAGYLWEITSEMEQVLSQMFWEDK